MFEERKNRASHKKREEAVESRLENSQRLSTARVPLKEPELFQTRNVFWQVAKSIVFGFLEGGRMVRRVGPNDRPLERHEFERLEFTTQQRRSGWRW